MDLPQRKRIRLPDYDYSSPGAFQEYHKLLYEDNNNLVS